MTDRFSGLFVVLENDIREDDAEAIVSAIQQLRGVLTVSGHVSSGFDIAIAESRVRADLGRKIYDVLHPKAPGS